MADSDRLNDLRIDRSEPEAVGSGPRFTLIMFAFLLLVLVLGAGWWYLQTRNPQVEVATARQVSGDAPRAASAVLDASGYVTARLRATVSSKTTGKIVEVLVEEGLNVEEGQVLARLDDALVSRQKALAEAQLIAAKSALKEIEVRIDEARTSLERSKKLLTAGVATQADLDAAQATVDALDARLAESREQIFVAERQLAVRQQELEDMVIRAPFTGVVVTKAAQPGEMISPVSAGGGFTRTGICTLVDMNSLEIEVDVNEAFINRVRPDQKVQAVLDAYPDWQIPARVITPVPTADRQRATVLVRIGFEALDPRILPDMGVKVSFLEEESDEPAPVVARNRITVPAMALRQDGEATIVLVVNGDRLERRAVQSRPGSGDQVEIEAGLQAGEQVVIAGPEDLADGDLVRVR